MNNITDKNWTIKEIEALTEQEAKELSCSTSVIKEHNVYFVDFTGRFGYSCLVFRDGHHVHYANDYELLHPGRSRDELHELFVDSLNGELFTDAEILAPLYSYDEYNRKSHFLHNYYIMRTDHRSIFGSEGRGGFTVYSPVAFAWCREEDRQLVEHINALYDALEANYAAKCTDPEFMYNAFVYQMFNHEYAINWQGDWDVVSCFANVPYHDDWYAEEYCKAAGFTPEVTNAYLRAAHYVHEHSDF